MCSKWLGVADGMSMPPCFSSKTKQNLDHYVLLSDGQTLTALAEEDGAHGPADGVDLGQLLQLSVGAGGEG